MFGYMFTLITGVAMGEDGGGLRSLASLFQRGHISLCGPALLSTGSGFAVEGGVSRFAWRSRLHDVVCPARWWASRLTAITRGSSPSDPG